MRLPIKRLYGTAALLIGTVLLVGTSCSKDNRVGGDGEGKLSLGIVFDSKTIEGAESKSAVTKAEPDYAVSVRDSQGRKIRQYKTKAEVPAEIWLQTGDYTIEVVSGKDEVAAFDSPYFLGKEEVSIIPNQPQTVQVSCKLANAKVTVECSDRIKSNFRSFVVEIGPSPTKMLSFDETATQTGYYKTEEGAGATVLNWNMVAVTNSGREVTREGYFTAEPQRHYNVEFDLTGGGEGGEGGWEFLEEITVNEDVTGVDDPIEIPLKRLPQIKGIDFDIKQDYFILIGNTPELKIELTGTPTIDSVGVMHDCQYLLDKGIPTDFKLLTISEGAKNQLNAQGFTWTVSADNKSIVVDLTALIPKLGESTSHFEFGVKDETGKRNKGTLTLMIIDSDVITVSVTNALADIWGGHIVARGKWTSAGNPGNLAFEYKKESESSWTKVTEGITVDNAGTGEFSAKLRGLTPGTKYNYRASSNNIPGNQQTVTTENAIYIDEMNFDNWYKGGTSWYATSQSAFEADSYWLDSGNGGTSSSLGGGVNPTEPETVDVYKAGGKAVKMSSKVVSIAKQFAAGNIFTGRFKEVTISPMGAKLDFGRPYTARPTKIRGYFKYIPAAVTHPYPAGGLNTGDMDYCNIHVALCDWNEPFHASTGDGRFPDFEASDVIAYGAFSTNETISNYTAFEIEIEWRDPTRRPKYIVFAASASKYGDYFAGGEGSVLWLDECELVFD